MPNFTSLCDDGGFILSDSSLFYVAQWVGRTNLTLLDENGPVFRLARRTLGYQFLVSAEEDVSGQSYDRLPDSRKIAYFVIYCLCWNLAIGGSGSTLSKQPRLPIQGSTWVAICNEAMTSYLQGHLLDQGRQTVNARVWINQSWFIDLRWRERRHSRRHISCSQKIDLISTSTELSLAHLLKVYVDLSI